jgi:DNA-directed RNA polymerase alpha subunit
VFASCHADDTDDRMTNEPIWDLPKLSSPARRALTRAGYGTLEQLAQTKETDIAKLHGMGPKAIDQLRESLHKRGLSFKT